MWPEMVANALYLLSQLVLPARTKAGVELLFWGNYWRWSLLPGGIPTRDQRVPLLSRVETPAKTKDLVSGGIPTRDKRVKPLSLLYLFINPLLSRVSTHLLYHLLSYLLLHLISLLSSCMTRHAWGGDLLRRCAPPVRAPCVPPPPACGSRRERVTECQFDFVCHFCYICLWFLWIQSVLWMNSGLMMWILCKLNLYECEEMKLICMSMKRWNCIE
jgi:hypothetical protein